MLERVTRIYHSGYPEYPRAGEHKGYVKGYARMIPKREQEAVPLRKRLRVDVMVVARDQSGGDLRRTK